MSPGLERTMRTLRRLMCLVVALPASAQQPPPSDSLPRDLVIALLGGSLGMRQVSVQAGMADDSIPADEFRDALLLGFADYRVSRTTVAYFPYTPQATIDTITARLVAAGWTRPTATLDSTRGFISSGSPGVSQFSAVCRGRSIVVPSVAVRTINRTLAIISRQESFSRRDLCGEGEESPRRMLGFNPAANTPLPKLPPPAAMQSSGGGSSGGPPDKENALTMHSELQGAVSIRDIMTHYTSIFTRNGWNKVDDLAANSAAIASFEITVDGKTWHCAFVVSAPSTERADVHLTLRQR